jgi:hypothetical protein
MTDKAEEETLIIAKGMKFRKKTEAGDGNCMFRSIGTGLNKTHVIVRRRVVSHAFENWEQYKEIIMKVVSRMRTVTM